MSFDLSRLTTEKQSRAPRIVLLGVEKIGKSTFACSAPNPVVLPIKGEEGIDDLVSDAVHSTPTCESLADVLGWLYSLYSGEHDRQTVVIDSASALKPILEDSTIARWNQAKEDKQKTAVSIETIGGGYGKGVNEALVEWRLLTEALDALRDKRDMASIIIGHVVIKQTSDPITGLYDAFEFDIDKKAANLLYRWADCILFANHKAVVKKEDAGFNREAKRGIDIGQGGRFLYTQKRPAHPGGGRGAYGHIPYELPLDFNTFMEAVSQVK